MTAINRHLAFLLFWALLPVSNISLANEDAAPRPSVAFSELGPLAIAQRYEINSAALNEKREIYISLPESYATTNHQYPVLYLLDADQNMPHAVASAQMLAAWRGIPELIIVGIPSTNRTRDYTPSQVLAYSEQSGGGDAFMSFIKDELVPIMDTTYRTHPFRILSGHSLSGLIAANELVNASDTFQAYIIIAPSLWWHDFEILETAEQKFRQYSAPETAVYFGIGELDGYGMKQELLRFTQAIDQADVTNIRYEHSEYPNEGHMSAPMSVTYDGLLSVFSDIPYPRSEWATFNREAFMAREQHLRDKYGSTAVQTAEHYVALGHYLLEENKVCGAISVFESNVRTNPTFAPYYDWLAEAYVLAGNIPAARANYQQAYDLTMASVTGQGNAEHYLEKIARLELPKSSAELTDQQRQLTTGENDCQ